MDETHFIQARQTMVDCQIRPTKVTDETIIDAFATVPREALSLIHISEPTRPY